MNDQPSAPSIEVEFVKAIGWMFVAVVCLPLLIPLVVLGVRFWFGPTKTLYWVVPRWWVPVTAIGAGVVVVVLGAEVWWAVAWVRGGGPLVWETVVRALAVNVVLGVGLVPGVWSWQRRRIARRVSLRRVDDVVMLERIEDARWRAGDVTVARWMGVRLDPSSGRMSGVPRLCGPLQVDQAQAVGRVIRPTVRTVRELVADRRVIDGWQVGRWVVMPETPSDARAIIIAESGTGKTVVINHMVMAAARRGWPVVVVDAKGNPADGLAMAEGLRAEGVTVSVGGAWNLFAGTAHEITARLMRLLPVPDGPGAHYTQEIHAVLMAVQGMDPLRSADDLVSRVENPEQWVTSRVDLSAVTSIVDRAGTTSGMRATKSVLAALRPLLPYVTQDGWSFGHLGAQVVIMPISPVNPAEAVLGDLLVQGLRQHMDARFKSGESAPFLGVVDEFPQIASPGVDPADMAASTMETARSAGVGLILAAQSIAGLSTQPMLQTRLMSSGAAILVGRTKDPEGVAGLAGTVMRMEASGDAHDGQLKSGRAQHTYVIPPQRIREALPGQMWLIAKGVTTPLRVLPPRHHTPTPQPTKPPRPTPPPPHQSPPVAVQESTPTTSLVDLADQNVSVDVKAQLPAELADGAKRSYLVAKSRRDTTQRDLATAQKAVLAATAKLTDIDPADTTTVVQAQATVHTAEQMVDRCKKELNTRQLIFEQAQSKLEQHGIPVPTPGDT